MYYGFQYTSGKNTTTGTPNRMGKMSIAGCLESFRTKKERDEWVARGHITPDMQGPCRVSVKAKDIHSFKAGWTAKQWGEWRDFQEQVNYIVSP